VGRDEESERAILFLDIQGFGRPDRTDEDRAAVRRTLQEITHDLLVRVDASGEISDTGDGLLGVLSPSVGERLVPEFFPSLERRLSEHNCVASRSREIRVRMVLSQGTSQVDTAALTGSGVVSTAVNRASRLLDSAQLRDDLANARGRTASLMVSDDYYAETVVTKNPAQSPAFRRVLVRAKDGVQVAWIYRPEFRYEPGQPVPGLTATPVLLRDLRPHLAVSAFDVHVYDLYEETMLTVPLEWQLATALLLSDGAMVHCADPYRRAEARALLERYREFVENGEILFLLGGPVRDVRRDYRNYLESKAHSYAQSRHSERDVESLEAPLYGTDALDRAIDLLESSPWRLHRGYSGTSAFRHAIRRDIRAAEEIVTSVRPVQKLRMVNLTLYQLLTLSYVSGGRLRRTLADFHEIERFLEELHRLTQQQVLSRQIILGALRNHFGVELREQETLRSLIEARIHSLYMSTTVAPHAHVEVTPRRDEQSPYYYGHLQVHLDVLVEDEPYELSSALVRRLRDCPDWPAFARHHLACVAEVAALRLADGGVEPEVIFRRHLHPGAFRSIAELLRQP
jgi:hypothetical protein